MKEGFYYISKGDVVQVLVHGYHCKDLGGKFVFGFNTHDGGHLVTIDDLTDDTLIAPVRITPLTVLTKSQFCKSGG